MVPLYVRITSPPWLPFACTSPTAYYTGFRNSELRFLTWQEIDFDRRVITLTNKEGFSLKNRESTVRRQLDFPFRVN